jgi:hypothetical protein
MSEATGIAGRRRRAGLRAHGWSPTSELHIGFLDMSILPRRRILVDSEVSGDSTASATSDSYFPSCRSRQLTRALAMFSLSA